MGMAAAEASDPGGGEHLVPALPPDLADGTKAPPNLDSPWRRKAASMAAVVPVEGGEHGGGEYLIPAFPPLLSDRMKAPPNPPSPWRRKAASMAAADGGEHGGGQHLIRASPTRLSDWMEDHPTATTTAASNPLCPCNGSKEFEIDWGHYLAHDARMLTQGEAIECSTAQVGSSSQLNDVGADRHPNVVNANRQPEHTLADPFDNEEEYVGVDDENMFDVTIPITIAVQPEVPSIIEGDDNMDEAEVIQEEAEVADFDPLQYNIAHDPEKPDIRVRALFPDIVAFRKAIRYHVVIADFEFANVRTDQSRFIADCAYETCPWRIHASRLHDEAVIMIKKISFEHDCPTTKLEDSKMASQDWVAEKLADWVKKNPGADAKQARVKLQDEYNFKLKYSKAWAGIRLHQPRTRLR